MPSFATAKVCDLDEIVRNEDVLRLDIAMEDILPVHVLNGT